MSLIVLKCKTRNGGFEAEAVRFNGQNGPELAKWCGGTYNIAGKFKGPNREVTEVVQVPNNMNAGFLNCFRGDYVVKLGESGCYPLNSVTYHQLFAERV